MVRYCIRPFGLIQVDCAQRRNGDPRADPRRGREAGDRQRLRRDIGRPGDRGRPRSKGAFFHHFDSKVGLARSLVERYAAADVCTSRHATAHAPRGDRRPGRPGGRVPGFFEDAADEIMSRAVELPLRLDPHRAAAGADGTSEPIVKAVLAWREALPASSRDAAAGRHTDVDADALADHVFVHLRGRVPAGQVDRRPRAHAGPAARAAAARGRHDRLSRLSGGCRPGR